ncbi:Ig-like domain-containing protein, partial [Salipiger sp.]|uniref:Ig-like domain-containing protein n=1 Tax=Salipiger sp. TaxID=2078585 RepID=UPI003A975C28
MINSNTLVTGLGGPAGYGEIRLPSGDDLQIRVDVSAVFENGFHFYDVSYSAVSDFLISTNGFIGFGNNSYRFHNYHDGVTNATTPIIAGLWTDLMNMGEADIFVDIDTIGDVVTVTWLDVGYYGFNGPSATASFQVQLFDNGEPGDLQVVVRYENVESSGYSVNAVAGVHFGDFTYQIPTAGNAANLPGLTGNTGIDGAWTFAYTREVLEVTDATFGTDEDVALTLTEADLLSGATTDDGRSLSLVSVGLADFGDVVLNGDGTVSVTAPPDYYGPVTFAFTVSDGVETRTATATVEVAPVNDLPIAQDDRITGARSGGGQVITQAELTGNDVDIDGDALSVESVGGATDGTVTLQSDGTILFTPDAAFTGTAGFIYTTSDGAGGTDTAQVSVEVSALTPFVSLRGLDGVTGEFLVGEYSSVTATFGAPQIVGDVNGDGLDDVLIGGRLIQPSGYNVYFREDSYLLFGNSDGFDGAVRGQDVGTFVRYTDAVSLVGLDGVFGFRMPAPSQNSALGSSITALGDINGDSIPDFGIADPSYDASDDQGRLHIVYGGGLSWPAELALDSAGSGQVGSITGAAVNDFYGYTGGSATDINGDGQYDVVLVSSSADPLGRSSAGEVAIFYGTGGTFGARTTAQADLRILGGSVDDLNNRMSTGGDINGDGMDDLLLSTGDAIFMIYGRDAAPGTAIDLDTLSTSDGIRIDGTGIGFDFTFVGDINADGYDDFAITQEDAGVNGGGVVHVVFGAADGLASGVDLAALDGTRGFTIGGAPAGADLGSNLAALGDVNGDGVDDIGLVAYGTADADSQDRRGTAYVIFGSEVGYPAMLDITALNGLRGFSLDESRERDSTSQIGGGGDVNGDGVNDILITGWNGIIYLVYGFENGAVTLPEVPQLVTDHLSTQTGTVLTIEPATLLNNDLDDGPLTGILDVIDPLGGTVMLDASGQVVFTPADDFVGQGGFTYVVEDTDGNQATGIVSIEVTESPVDAVLSGAFSGSVQEAGPDLSAEGHIIVTDPNRGENRLQVPDAVALAGDYGTFSVSATGTWSYEVDLDSAAFATLDSGEFAIDSVTVTSFDGTASRTIDVLIEGDDEALIDLSGSTYVVSDASAGLAYAPSVVERTDDRRALVWATLGADGSGTGVTGQVLNDDGSDFLAPYDLPLSTRFDQADPQVIALSGGGWAAAWTDASAAPGPVQLGVASYLLFGPEHGRNQVTAIGSLADPALAALSGGGYVLIARRTDTDTGTTNNDLFLQRFDDNSEAVGAPVDLPGTAGAETEPSATQLADGTLVISWQVGGTLMLMEMTESGSLVSGPVEAGISDVGGHGAQITALTEGGFVVTWDASGSTGGIKARIFDAAGSPRGEEIAIDTISDFAFGHDTTALLDGGFAVGWVRFSDGEVDVALQVVNAAGTLGGAPLDVGMIADTYDEALFDLVPVALAGDGSTDLSVFFPQNIIGTGDFRLVGQNVDIVLPIPFEVTADDVTALEENGSFRTNILDNDTGFRLRIVQFNGQTVNGRLDIATDYGTLTVFEGGEMLFTYSDPENMLPKGETAVTHWNVLIEDDSGTLRFQPLTLRLVGDTSGLTLQGTTRPDEIEGVEGNDTVLGGLGNDTISGNDGADSILGEEGDDLLRGGSGFDTLDAGAGGDRLYGDGGGDLLIGGTGADLLFGGAGRDSMSGGGASDTINAGGGADTVDGGIGSDTLRGDDGDDLIFGGDFGDLIFGGRQHDTLRGENGADTLIGGDGND